MNTWGVRGTLAAAGVAVVIAGAGAAAVHGATDSGPRMMGPPPGGPSSDRSSHQAGFGARPEEGTLHGEFVVAGGPGGFTTHLSQVGTLTSLSPTSATIRSTDGYSSTYAIPPGAGAPGVRIGDEVAVEATREGEAAVIRSLDQVSQPPLATGN